MSNRDLDAQILGIADPWHESAVHLDAPAGEVEVVVEHRTEGCCPACGKPCPGYHSRLRRWRHLDTSHLQTLLVTDVPRVKRPEHGVVQVSTPWSEPRSRFTALLGRVVIEWLKEASFSAVARRFHLTWDEVDGIMARAVDRGLQGRSELSPRRIGLDAARAPVAAVAAQGCVPAHRPRMGAEGDGLEAVRRHEHGLGAPASSRLRLNA